LKYDAILYDFDGTLLDTVPMIMESFRIAFLEVTGHEEDKDFLLSTIGLPLAQAFSHYEPDVQRALHDSYIRANNSLLATAVRSFDGVEEGLFALKQMGVRQGVVTSKRRDAALVSINQFGLQVYFDTIVTREDTTVHKPYPEPLYLGMKNLGIADVSRVLYVGDSVHDLRSATNAGMDSAAVNWTYMPKADLAAEKPKYWLERLTDLSCILSDTEL
jgi:pyrophosphatase PpaX